MHANRIECEYLILRTVCRKLELLDSAERNKQAKHAPHSAARHSLSYAQVKRRETEITFELGELKIRENKLLDE